MEGLRWWSGAMTASSWCKLGLVVLVCVGVCVFVRSVIDGGDWRTEILRNEREADDLVVDEDLCSTPLVIMITKVDLKQGSSYLPIDLGVLIELWLKIKQSILTNSWRKVIHSARDEDLRYIPPRPEALESKIKGLLRRGFEASESSVSKNHYYSALSYGWYCLSYLLESSLKLKVGETKDDLRWVPPWKEFYDGLVGLDLIACLTGKFLCIMGMVDSMSPSLVQMVIQDIQCPDWEHLKVMEETINLGKTPRHVVFEWIPRILELVAFWCNQATVREMCSQEWVTLPPSPPLMILVDDQRMARKYSDLILFSLNFSFASSASVWLLWLALCLIVS